MPGIQYKGSLGVIGWLVCLLLSTGVRAQIDGRVRDNGSRPGKPLKAGVSRVDITPALPMWMTGYAGRDTPATGIIHPIWAKALALEEDPNSRIIIVTTDLLGLSHEVSENVFNRIREKYGIRRSQLLLNSSHTHSGPMIWPCLDVIYDFAAADQRLVSAYSEQLTDNLVKVIEAAIADLSPAFLFSGHGQVDFAINRRNAIHPNGPVDHDVPVLKVTGPEGRLRAVLFGYACHNTTLVSDNTLINGDYAGFAQIEIEKNNPGATALFLMGCAGDQNPEPRGTEAYARQHGQTLGREVQRVLAGPLKAVNAPIRTDYSRVFLAYRPFDLKACEKDITGTNKFLQRRAKLMIEAYNKGWSVDKLAYPIQAVRFNKDFTILGLSDEVVVDYSMAMKREYAGENLYVAGYCSEVTCYIPSRRVLHEGGYEPDESMIYYGMPGPFADDVEARIHTTIRQVMKNVGARAVAGSPEGMDTLSYVRTQNLRGTRGTYAFPPRLPDGNIDPKRLIAELKDLHANTYHWLAWGKTSDLEAFKKFLPLARQAGIRVWITLVPPSESPPLARDFSEPYRLDCEKWAVELARLSLKEPELVAWSIDDFVHNLSLFTPDYLKKLLTAARAVNPRLAFVPCAYFEQVTPAFAYTYGPLIDGILFPYRDESVVANLGDAGNAAAEINSLRSLFAPGFPVFLDVYATAHSSLGDSSPEYVREVLAAGRESADGVMIYCHQDPRKFPEKYRVIREAFAVTDKPLTRP